MEDMMGSVAMMAMEMKAAAYDESYSVSMMKKTMDTVETEAQNLLEMMPQVPKGQYVDVYA